MTRLADEIKAHEHTADRARKRAEIISAVSWHVHNDAMTDSQKVEGIAKVLAEYGILA